MQYRADPKSGNKLSILGLGCMRFPRNPVRIDIKKAERIVLEAIERGVNYLDTAYIYFGSEETLGQIFKNNPGTREKIFLATKLPIGQCKSREDFDKYLNIQLERLNTDYIDYYFMHNLSSKSMWDNLCGLGIEKWIEEKKAAGKIRQSGFSFHGMQSEFFSLLDAYDWDFCQIQYNYININHQAGMAGLKAAAEKGLPVIVMEPLLGGKLATGLPKDVLKIFGAADKTMKPVDWALKWLWDQPEVTVVLSGMSSIDDLNENAAVAETAMPFMLAEKEKDVYASVIEAFNKSYKIPCTGCNYCMPCPSGVNIPACFSAYNMYCSVGKMTGLQQYVIGTVASSPEKNALAGRCVKCLKCEKLCPQGIKISNALEDVKKRMEPFWFKAAMSVWGRVKKD